MDTEPAAPVRKQYRTDDRCLAIDPKTRLICSMHFGSHGNEHIASDAGFVLARWAGEFEGKGFNRYCPECGRPMNEPHCGYGRSWQ